MTDPVRVFEVLVDDVSVASILADIKARPARLRLMSVGQAFDASQQMGDAIGAGPRHVLGLSHLHDWREHCNACPVCEWHDGFHDEARHAARVTIPARCLIPSGSDKRPVRVGRSPEEIEAVRRSRASQREGT